MTLITPVTDADKKDLRDGYQDAVTRLTDNINRPLQDWTQQMAVQEIIFLSRLLLIVAKILRKLDRR